MRFIGSKLSFFRLGVMTAFMINEDIALFNMELITHVIHAHVEVGWNRVKRTRFLLRVHEDLPNLGHND